MPRSCEGLVLGKRAGKAYNFVSHLMLAFITKKNDFHHFG
jgi:hypothetical protein